MTLSIKVYLQHQVAAEFHILIIVILSIVMLSVVMLGPAICSFTYIILRGIV